MNKAELVEAIVGDFPSKAAAERAVGAVIAGIKQGVVKDGKVQLIGFGTFTVKKRKARTGRNPQTGATIKIKASKTVAFKPGKAMKDML
jgi:DNA-binding protein HU-beta